jgi:hypothetical protein
MIAINIQHADQTKQIPYWYEDMALSKFTSARLAIPGNRTFWTKSFAELNEPQAGNLLDQLNVSETGAFMYHQRNMRTAKGNNFVPDRVRSWRLACRGLVPD